MKLVGSPEEVKSFMEDVAAIEKSRGSFCHPGMMSPDCGEIRCTECIAKHWQIEYDHVVCPHCGYEHKDIPKTLLEAEIRCGVCGKDLFFRRNTTHSYTVEKE